MRIEQVYIKIFIGKPPEVAFPDTVFWIAGVAEQRPFVNDNAVGGNFLLRTPKNGDIPFIRGIYNRGWVIAKAQAARIITALKRIVILRVNICVNQ